VRPLGWAFLLEEVVDLGGVHEAVPAVTMKVMRRQRALAMGGNEGFEADVI
jgi:hypothetical protein